MTPKSGVLLFLRQATMLYTPLNRMESPYDAGALRRGAVVATTPIIEGEVDFGQALAEAIDDYRLSLYRTGKSPATQELYTLALGYLDAFLERQGMPRTLGAIRREHIEAWLGELRDTGRAPGTIHAYYRSIRPFWTWAIEEGEVKVSPMQHVKAPIVPMPVGAILSDDQLRALLRACKGPAFEDVRDRCIFQLLIDTPARREELAALRLDDVHQDVPIGGQITVTGKGNRWRTMPYGATTLGALRAYLRRRRTHPWANRTDRLWLGYRGPLTGNGILQMVERRARQAGIEGVHPHAFRHTWRHRAGRARMSQEGIMRIGGWRSVAMFHRYASSAADDRAREEYRTLPDFGRL
jgi:site-specific recombinase XerD